MKVLLLVHGLDVGGAEVMIAGLARHLRSAGDVVEIGCLGALGTIGTELRAEGFPVVVHPRRPGFDRTLPWRLARRIRSARVDVVHLHQRTALFYGLLGGLFHTVPIVYTEHGPPFDPPPSAKQRAFNRLLHWRLTRLTAVSRHTAESLRALEGFAGREIDLIPNAVDLERRAPTAHESQAARVDFGLPRDTPILVSVGRLVAVKNQQLLIRVVARLLKSDPRTLLLLIGEGPERACLEALARQLGVSDAVRFLGLRRDVQAVLPAGDVFCLSSVTEGIPLTVLEAMAARIPVVATAVGGIPEAVRADVDALLIEAPAGAEVFTSAVQRLLDDPALRQRLTENAFARVRNAFDIDTVCARYRSVLADAAGRCGP